MSNNDENILTCHNLQKTFTQGPEPVPVIQGINFDLKRGERVAIMGSSGSGKTTLLHLLAGLENPSAGEVRVMGESLSQANETRRGEIRNRHIGFVYQFHHLLPELTALENVMMPLALQNTSLCEATARATDLLGKVGLAKRIKHKPEALSGGERQRVALARALITLPACVLADEPTGNLDAHTAAEIQALIQDLNASYQIAFLIVTHDTQFAAQADRVLKLREGMLEESGTN